MRARSRVATRKQHLTNIANVERTFIGDIDQLPVIGKSHEGGVPSESIIKHLVNYVMKELQNGKDLALTIET